jgi:ABC-type sugar transport system permease subunit
MDGNVRVKQFKGLEFKGSRAVAFFASAALALLCAAALLFGALFGGGAVKRTGRLALSNILLTERHGDSTAVVTQAVEDGAAGYALTLIKDGQKRAERVFPSPISALKSYGGDLYAAGNDGVVYVLDGDLNDKYARFLNFKRAVSALDVADGTLFVAYGTPYTDFCYVQAFDVAALAGVGADGMLDGKFASVGADGLPETDGDGNPVTRYQTYMHVYALTALSGGDAVFITADGYRIRYGAGRQEWLYLCSGAARSLVSDGERLYTADDNGRVAGYGLDGKTLFETALTKNGQPLRALKVVGGHIVAFGDYGVFAVDGAGRVALDYGARGAAAFWGDDILFYDGAVSSLDAGRFAAHEIFKTLSWVLGGVLAAAAVTAACLFLLAFKRTAKGFRRTAGRARKNWAAYMLVLPTFAVAAVFSFYPIVTALGYSFTSFNLIKPVTFVGFDNFARIFSDPILLAGGWRSAFVNMAVLVATALLQLLFPFLMAELIFNIKSAKGRYVMRTLYIIPSVVPGVVSIILWKMLLEPRGIMAVLSGLGIPVSGKPWLSSDKTALWAIIFSGFPYVNVFAFLIIMGGLLSIDTSIYEAARLDGIGVWKRFAKIDLPLVMRQIKLVLISTFISSIQGFMNIMIFTEGGSSTMVPALHMYYQVQSGEDFGYASSIGMLIFLLIMGMTLFTLRKKDPDY